MLINKWKLNYKDYKDLEGTVPCSLYSILLDHGLIDDPYYRMNEYDVRELSRDDYEMHTTFDVSEGIIGKKNIFLRFSGLDTVCEVFVNEVKVGNANNMHRTWSFDIKDVVCKGENKIHIIFHSPVEYIEKKNARHFVNSVPEAMDGHAHIRKAFCMFGWDWAPQLPDMGIHRNVELLAYDDAKIHDFYVSQKHKEGKAYLDISLEADKYEKATASVISPDNTVFETEFEESIDGLHAKLTIDNPDLWWPNGYGDQPLYEVTVTTFNKNGKADTMTKKIGLRTLTVSRRPDKWGEEFCFVVNGEKIFSMGADYIPEDSILARTNSAHTRKLLEDCVRANYNTIRVWGGGQYPTDEFFDICDELGLIVWQDFMIACANVNLSEEFEENFMLEAEDNIKRIRNHASLGILCGNNELEIGIADWDGVGDSEKVRADYLRLYEKLIPDLCEKLAGDTFYWPASPSSGGGFVKPNDFNKGDVHYWDVWFGNKPFEDVRNYYFRYCSEFGFEAFPNMKTIKAFAAEDDLNPFSPVMESHQKCKSGNARILTYMADNYLYAMDFEKLVYISQLLQADAIKYGVEHMRRNRGRCMGAIYWQLNDCWPVASWASIDYYGRWKALHYSAKKFFAPILLSVLDEGSKVTLNVSNETRNEFTGKAIVALRDTDFNDIYKNEIEVNVDKLSAKDIFTEDMQKYINGREDKTFLHFSLYDESGNIISHQSLLFVKPKAFCFPKPEIKVEITKENDIAIFKIKSDKYAKGVSLDFENIDLLLSDNYFDMDSTDAITITAKTDADIDTLKKELIIQHV